MESAQFTQLYTETETALHNFAKKLVYDNAKAQDLVQETAIKAFKSRHTFREGSSFKSWTFTILKNTFISQYHKKKRRGVVNKPIEDFTFALENQYAVKNDALSHLNVDCINEAIENLSYKSKLPFKMFIEGYQYKEISNMLNIPIGTVKSRINFARTKLKGYVAHLRPEAA